METTSSFAKEHGPEAPAAAICPRASANGPIGVLLFGEFPPFSRRIQQPAPIAAIPGRAELAACMGARAASMRRLSAMPSSRVSTRATRPVESETSARNPAVSGPQSVLHREHAGPQPRLRSRRDDRGMQDGARRNRRVPGAPAKLFSRETRRFGEKRLFSTPEARAPANGRPFHSPCIRFGREKWTRNLTRWPPAGNWRNRACRARKPGRPSRL